MTLTNSNSHIVAPSDPTPIMREGVDEATTTDLPFHRHCQKTICSAHGLSGDGATWGVIDTLNLNNL